jgi:uncharacterized protein (TIGR02117 family)
MRYSRILEPKFFSALNHIAVIEPFNAMKLITKSFLIIGFIFLLLPLGYLCLSTIGAFIPVSTVKGFDEDENTRIKIILLSSPIHTDVFLPATPRVREKLAFLNSAKLNMENPNLKWLGVGWGSRDFYTNVAQLSDVTPNIIYKAIFGDDAVIRLGAYGAFYDGHGGHGGLEIYLTNQQLEKLVDYMKASFVMRHKKPQLLQDTHLAGQDLFYQAKGDYNITFSCNQWVNHGLRAAGIKIGLWTPTPWALNWSLKFFAK